MCFTFNNQLVVHSMEKSSETIRNGKLLKVLLIGQSNVGKSSITKRYVENKFDPVSFVTIGSYYTLKKVTLDSNLTVNLQLWNLAGHESYRKVNSIHYRGTKGVIVVFDITDHSTLEAAAEWKEHLDHSYCLESGHPVPAILLANKCDLARREVDCVSSLDTFCRDNGFKGWFETSAKENINIHKAITFLIKQMLLCNTSQPKETHREDTIKLSQTPMETQSSCWSRPTL